jgi:hypothetical protein
LYHFLLLLRSKKIIVNFLTEYALYIFLKILIIAANGKHNHMLSQRSVVSSDEDGLERRQQKSAGAGERDHPGRRR